MDSLKGSQEHTLRTTGLAVRRVDSVEPGL